MAENFILYVMQRNDTKLQYFLCLLGIRVGFLSGVLLLLLLLVYLLLLFSYAFNKCNEYNVDFLIVFTI